MSLYPTFDGIVRISSKDQYFIVGITKCNFLGAEFWTEPGEENLTFLANPKNTKCIKKRLKDSNIPFKVVFAK